MRHSILLKTGFWFFTLAIIHIFIFGSFSISSRAEEQNEYKIGIDDVIKVYVWQYEQFNAEATVGPDGKVTVPLLGNIYVEGLTRDEVKNEVTRRLSKYIKEGVEVTISILQYRSQKISIFGQVRNPRTITFSSAPSFLEVILQSEFMPEADLTSVKVIPVAPTIKDIVTVNVAEILQTGTIPQLPELRSGDTIYVPKIPVVKSKEQEEKPSIIIQNMPAPQTPVTKEAEKEKFVIHVTGSVRVPSTLEFPKQPSLMEVLLKAGSVTDNEAMSSVRVIRADPRAKDKIVDVNLKKYLEKGDVSILPALQPGDIVYIPDITQERLKELSIIVTGAVAKPGAYRTSEFLNILDAISLAGGLTKEADPEMIRISRESGDLQEEKIVNIEDFLGDSVSTEIPEMVGPGYRVYVPAKRASISNLAYGIRGIVTFFVDLAMIYGYLRFIRN